MLFQSARTGQQSARAINESTYDKKAAMAELALW